MSKQFPLAVALLLAAGTVSAQSGKIKVKAKPGRATTQPVALAAPVAETDWSLPYAATITPVGLKADLDVLASDAYEGRETGKKGQKMAADYIAKAFAADGLAGPVAGSDNPYIQHFGMRRTSLDLPASIVKAGGQTFQGKRDFYAVLTNEFAAPITLQPVFVGYGIKEDKYSDFATPADYTGKDIVLLAGEPLNAQGKSLIGAEGKPSAYAPATLAGLRARGRTIYRLGARSFIVVMPTAAAFAAAPKGYSMVLGREDLVFDGDKEKRAASTSSWYRPKWGPGCWAPPRPASTNTARAWPRPAKPWLRPSSRWTRPRPKPS